MILPRLVEQLFVGGEWVGSAASGGTFDVTNPANNEPIATLPDAGREEMQAAIDAAANAQDEWAATTAAYRAAIMRRAADLMHERKEHLATVMTLEQGKPLAESRAEIAYAASFLEWFADEAKRVYGDTVPATARQARYWSSSSPVGVVGRDHAVELPRGHDHAQARAAPSPPAARWSPSPPNQTPLSALVMAELAERPACPKASSTWSPATPPAIAAAIMEHPRVRKLSFTGSTEVGKLLMGSRPTR